MTFDFHREMTDAVARLSKEDADSAVWVMNAPNIEAFRQFQERQMGCAVDVSESFGIPIELGEPSDGRPFELKVRRQR